MAPELSAQLSNAPDGKPHDTLNLAPEAPDLPRLDMIYGIFSKKENIAKHVMSHSPKQKSEKTHYSVPLKRLSKLIDFKHLGIDSSDDDDGEYKVNVDTPKNTKNTSNTTKISKNLDFLAIQKQWLRIKPKNINSILMKKESSITINCPVFRTCNCVKRLIFLLQKYNDFCRKNINYSTNTTNTRTSINTRTSLSTTRLSMNDIINTLSDYSLVQFWDDFIHTKEAHFQINASSSEMENNFEKENIERVFNLFNTKLGKCEYLNKCVIHSRNIRCKEECTSVLVRKQLYYGYCSSEEIVCIQYFDTIHDYIFHSRQILYPEKYPPYPPSVKKISIVNNYGRRISSNHRRLNSKILETKESEGMERRKITVKEITNKEMKDNEEILVDILVDDKFHSKFITEVFDQTSMINIKPSFGISFVYWNGYRGWNNYISSSYYKNLKVELLNNKLYAVCVEQWNDIVLKSLKMKQSNFGIQWKAKNAGILNKRYNIPVELPISQPHIICILFYINFKMLAYFFKRYGCRKLHRKEMKVDVRGRNVLIGNWYKLFTECVTLFGDITTNEQVFYHGLSEHILFDEFKPNFNCMISCTANLRIVQNLIQDNYSQGLLSF